MSNGNMVLTILHKKEEPLTMFGTLDGGEVVQAGGSVVDADNFVLRLNPMFQLR